jgi:uncharacterized membrane protein YkvA (DUF1232 family)
MRPPRSVRRIGWFRALGRYYRDPSASVLGRLVAFFAAIYVVLPVDLIPDVPLIGWADDLGVMGLATMWLSHVVGRYRAAPLAPGGETERSRFSVVP